MEPSRLAFAKNMVPSCQTYQVDIKKSAQENGTAVRSLFGETEYAMPRVALECTGVESSVCSAAYTVRRGGTLMVVGVGKSIMNNLPFMHISLAEVRLPLGSTRALESRINRSHTHTDAKNLRSSSGSSTDTETLGPRASHASQEG